MSPTTGSPGNQTDITARLDPNAPESAVGGRFAGSSSARSGAGVRSRADSGRVQGGAVAAVTERGQYATAALRTLVEGLCHRWGQ